MTYRSSFAAFASSCALIACGSSAEAHALLKSATPAVGSTVSASPKEIRINFSEGVEPRFSGLTLTAQSGASAPVGKSSVDPADSSTMITPVAEPLKPGVYTVNWHAVAVDTHKTQGSFQFTVQP
jgi:copper resistance protein C